MSRNWLRAFKPAQYRGATFKVESEAPEGAKRLSITPVAYSRQNVIEEMGGEPRAGTIRAYCAGDEADSECLALVAAMERPGAGLLVLPMFPAMRAYVRGWRVVRRLQIAGYVAIDIDFVEEGLASVPFAVATGAGAFGDLIGALGDILAAGAAERYSLAGADAQAAEVLAMRAVRDRSASLAVTASAGAVIGDAVSDALAALDTAVSGGVPDAAIVTRSVSTFWRRLAVDADAEALVALAAEIDAAPATDAAAVEALAIAGAWCTGLIRQTYAAQPDAAAARERAGQTAARARPAAERFGYEALDWLNGITGLAARVLAAGDADRAPLVRVETQVSIDAITLAYDLYGDATRAGEIIDRNALAAACLMPVTLEALAP